MNELMNVEQKQIGSNLINTVNAKDVYVFLEVIKTRYDIWLNRAIEKYGFIEEVDFCTNLNESTGGRPTKDYYVSINMAKELAMTEDCPKGKEARLYFIECEKKAQQSTAVSLPTTYVEALEHLIIQAKKNVELQANLDKLMHTNKTYVSSEIAKELGLKSAQQLHRLLHAHGIIYKRNGTWLPYGEYSDMGLCEIKQGLATNGKEFYNMQWTQKGREFLIEFLKGVN